jgi:hypothetical protein
VEARLTASSISATLTDLQTGTARGAVLAAFRRSVYLEVAGRIVALTAAPVGRGPLAIVVGGTDGLRATSVGDPAEVAAGTLRTGPLTVGLTGAATWDPALPLAALAEDKCAVAWHCVTGELLSRAPSESIAALVGRAGSTDHSIHGALLSRLERGLRPISAFLSGDADFSLAARAIGADVAGLGPGLTPSGDDLLTGIMHAVTLWPQIAARAGGLQARRAIAEAARGRTTRISSAYLEAAGAGLATEPWHRLVRSLTGPTDALRAAVRAMLRVGETSGADALTGFCWAWRGLFL